MSKKKDIKLKDLLKEQSFFLGFGNMGKKAFQPEIKREEKIAEDSYHSSAIDDFIKKNDTGDKNNIPRLKVFGDKGDTKFLNVSFDALREISKILKNQTF